jgi:hypothetical protein
VLLVPFGYDLLVFGLFLVAAIEVMLPAARTIDLEIDPALDPYIRRYSVYLFPEGREYLAMWIRGRIRRQ